MWIHYSIEASSKSLLYSVPFHLSTTELYLTTWKHSKTVKLADNLSISLLVSTQEMVAKWSIPALFQCVANKWVISMACLTVLSCSCVPVYTINEEIWNGRVYIVHSRTGRPWASRTKWLSWSSTRMERKLSIGAAMGLWAPNNKWHLYLYYLSVISSVHSNVATHDMQTWENCETDW